MTKTLKQKGIEKRVAALEVRHLLRFASRDDIDKVNFVKMRLKELNYLREELYRCMGPMSPE